MLIATVIRDGNIDDIFPTIIRNRNIDELILKVARDLTQMS